MMRRLTYHSVSYYYVVCGSKFEICIVLYKQVRSLALEKNFEIVTTLLPKESWPEKVGEIITTLSPNCLEASAVRPTVTPYAFSVGYRELLMNRILGTSYHPLRI